MMERIYLQVKGLVKENWRRLLVFGVIGYAVAFLRAGIITYLIISEVREDIANAISLLVTLVVVYLLHYNVTWRSKMPRLPLKRNAIRCAVLFPGFAAMVGVGLIFKFLTYPLIRLVSLSPWAVTIAQDTVVGVLDYFLHNEVSFYLAEELIRRRWPRLVTLYEGYPIEMARDG